MMRLTMVIGLVGLVWQSAHAQPLSDSKPRQLVPGVMTTIRDASIDDATVDQPRKFVELLRAVNPRAWTPNFDPTTQTLLDKANAVTFRRDVWSLEFSFKPLRIVRVGGRDVWYLVYSVRNNGDIRSPRLGDSKVVEISSTSAPVRFVPTFVMLGHDTKIERYDRHLPDVVSVIAAKERVPGRLLSSQAISSQAIPVSTPTEDHVLWGVATFDNVDPNTDYITIYVQGLTNAYQLERVAEDSSVRGRVLAKTLELNFWRPGDSIQLHEQEVRYGVPLYPDEPSRQQEVLKMYELDKPLDYRWGYR